MGKKVKQDPARAGLNSPDIQGQGTGVEIGPGKDGSRKRKRSKAGE
jgi:hypothetical protein